MTKFSVGTPYIFWHYLEVEAEDSEDAADKAAELGGPYAEGFGRGVCVEQGSVNLCEEPAIGSSSLDVEVEEIE